jgi:hypothetical protein
MYISYCAYKRLCIQMVTHHSTRMHHSARMHHPRHTQRPLTARSVQVMHIIAEWCATMTKLAQGGGADTAADNAFVQSAHFSMLPRRLRRIVTVRVGEAGTVDRLEQVLIV